MFLQYLGKCARLTRCTFLSTKNCCGAHNQLPPWRSLALTKNTSSAAYKGLSTRGQLLSVTRKRSNVWLVRLKNTAPECGKAKPQTVKLRRKDVLRLISLAKSEKFVLAGKD